MGIINGKVLFTYGETHSGYLHITEKNKKVLVLFFKELLIKSLLIKNTCYESFLNYAKC